MKIPFFNRYQSWKAHYTWKKTIKTEKMAESSKVLSQNLFLLNSTFQPSLLRVRELCADGARVRG